MKIIEPSYKVLDCPDAEKCLSKLEFIGRLAYKSEDRITEGERCTQPVLASDPSCELCGGTGWLKEPSSYKLLRNILKANRREQLRDRARSMVRELRRNPVGADVAKLIVDMVLDTIRDDPPHESVIEHEHITVLFTSNRGFTHELVRHRLSAFTQESTRYCNYSKGKFGSEITVTERLDEEILGMLDSWVAGVEAVESRYMEMVAKGVKPQIARDLLPQVLKADIVMTCNLRQWRHVFRMRCSPKAHPDMRRLMIPLRDELRQRIPIIFDEL